MNTPSLNTRPISVDDDVRRRFWLKVDTSGGKDACWNWKGKKQNGGYGVLHRGAKKNDTAYAHRTSYAINTGDPTGFLVCHRCDNPSCVNPSHLFLGTVADNVNDMIEKGRNTVVKAPTGEAAGSAKLTEREVVAIRLRAAAGEGSSRLGRIFGVDSSTIRAIVRRELWKHVGGGDAA